MGAMKIFWAFDPFEYRLETDVFVAETLSSLNGKLHGEVHPVYVLGSEIFNSSLITDTLGNVTKITEDKLHSIMKHVHVAGILRPDVIFEHSFSKTEIVKRFVEYAEKNDAKLVAVGSHGRRGLERALLGSFAETLLLQCHLPVIVVGSHFDQIPHWNDILFATDFSDESSYAFEKALQLAKRLSSRMTILHHVSPMIDLALQSAVAPFGGVWNLFPGEMKSVTEKVGKNLDDWADRGRASGVEIRTYLDAEASDTSEAILHYAEKNRMGLIAMGAQSGAVSTTIFGAITRRVVREAQCPVWVLRK